MTVGCGVAQVGKVKVGVGVGWAGGGAGMVAFSLFYIPVNTFIVCMFVYLLIYVSFSYGSIF